ncbi:fimbrial protein [Citrobacter freundii]|uniref:fimbrial protein n=1 Tax=Citrobacter freundii TaxID=546 RepID=UPI00178665D7|nr:fimbrial protein [Citrobacter freundii]MBD9990434.1 type 1 fimbrial protein [Citrobacter freundii]MBE0052595.1 type 1 fimbrial protein [Citrobacter freundii]MDT7291825.1 fimbrial protein [Citrobacter freundii]HBU6166540.1 type 1 fimbrial protein [Citrobacter freundii]HBV8018243.1 type 1 fimbrial protein [Citrobacter freundii]
MRKKIITSLFVSSVLATVAIPAFAVDTGTVTFNGKILSDSCKVDVNGSTTNGTVMFNNLSQTAFGADKKVGDTQSFAITLTECDNSINNLNIKFDGTRIAGYDEEVLQTTGAAQNLGVRMLPDGSSNYVKFDGSDPEASLNKAYADSVVFNYKAEVIQVGSTLPTTGDYTAQATYTLIYR